MGFTRSFALIGSLAGLALGQDCPILGPTYPEVLDPISSGVFAAAKASFNDEITKALASGQLDNGTAFSIQVFSRNSDKLLFDYHHGPSVGPDTLYRIGSISKVMTVYTTLAELGDKYWTEPVTKYVPELAKLKVQDPVYNTDWSEVTLGALASYLSGIARDCKSTLRQTKRLMLDADHRRCPRRHRSLPPARHPRYPSAEHNRANPVRYFRPAGMHSCRYVTLPAPPAASRSVPVPNPPLESLAKIARTYPISPTHHTPAYSNMAFQLLAYAVEKITNKKFTTLVDKQLLKPLKLTHTFLTKPTNASNALVLDGWDLDFGEESP